MLLLWKQVQNKVLLPNRLREPVLLWLHAVLPRTRPLIEVGPVDVGRWLLSAVFRVRLDLARHSLGQATVDIELVHVRAHVDFVPNELLCRHDYASTLVLFFSEIVLPARLGLRRKIALLGGDCILELRDDGIRVCLLLMILNLAFKIPPALLIFLL